LTNNPFGFPADQVLFDTGIGLGEQAKRRIGLFQRALQEFDVIHFNFGQTIIEPIPPQLTQLWASPRAYLRHLAYHALWHMELPLLRAMKKVIVMTYQGDDARQGDFCRATFGISPAHTADHYTAQSDECKRQAIRRVASYADRIYVLNPDLLRVLPEHAQFLPYASLDPREWPICPAAEADVPVVVHAPTNRAAKGTDFILAAVDRLQGEGLRFEFVLVENFQREEARRLYERAHLVIDQLLVGWYGGFAAETMAMGKPVVCYIREQDLAYVPPEMARDLPLVNATPATIEQVLRELLTHRRADLAEIGASGRRFVEKWHDPRLIAAQVARDYACMLAGRQRGARRGLAAGLARFAGRYLRSSREAQ